MSTYWISERTKPTIEPDSDEDETSWQERVRNLPDVEVLIDTGRRMKVRANDYVALHMTCSDTCRIEKV